MTTGTLTHSNTFVLLISRHRTCGAVLSLWEAGPENEGKFVLECRVSFPLQENSPEEEINALVNSLDDHEIFRKFSRKGQVMKAFFEKLPDELLNLQIRPYLDRQMDRIFRLAGKHHIPVFMNENSHMVFTRDRLKISADPAEPWFSFTRRDDGTDYVLEIYQQDSPVILNGKENQVICNNPCWFRAGNRLLHFPSGFDGKKIQPFLKKDAIRIPSSAEKKYFETFILKTLKTGQVKAEGFTVTTLEAPRSMEISVETDWQGTAILVIWFRYGKKRIQASKPQKVYIDLKMQDGSPAFYKTERNFEWESERLEFFKDSGLIPFNPGVFILPGEQVQQEAGMYSMIGWLNRNAGRIESENIRVSLEMLPKRFFTGNITTDFRVERNSDWFDILSAVRFGDQVIPFVRLCPFILEGTREFPLPDGTVAVIPEEWFTRFADLCYFSKINGDQFRLRSEHIRILEQIKQSGEDFTKIPEASQIATIQPPASLNAVLRPYQAEGLQWLWFLHEKGFGGCLADDMGLGKTIQVLSLMLHLQENRNHADRVDDPADLQSQPASLIVTPASLIHNWRNEIRRFAPSLSVIEHTGPVRTSNTVFFDAVDIVLTTYGILRNDLDMLGSYRFNYVVLDESQTVRNPSSRIHQAVCSLQSAHRLVLTGTPIENSLADLWSQMDFVNPGVLGDLSPFLKRYHDAEKVKSLISPFILRRTKQFAEPDLPPLTTNDIYCEMNPEQESLYEKEKSAVRNEILEQLETSGSPQTSIMVLKALIRLRQIANHPLLIEHDFKGDSGKSEEIMRIAATLHEEGHKTLVFSSFVKYLNLVAGWFDEAGLPWTMLTGSTINREQVIEKFRKDPACSFFLISLKAGGAGLNLQEADYVMLLDPWWNPAAEMQAIGRAHRIGQVRKVIALRFISKGSIEEKILALQQKKTQLAGDFIPAGNPLKNLTREELDNLFR
ncbi:MAG: DEAD/DEAH box helicase [Bacteroidota bacterium]|nr:DEAD/DEAH box helicase [Bacteroidota bacterium]